MRPRLTLSLAVGAATLSIASAEVSAPRYHVTDLGTLPGGFSSEAFAISDSGVIAGQSYADDQFGLGIRAFGWSNGLMNNLATRQLHGGLPHAGLAVNESGVIVGPTDNNVDSFLFQNAVPSRLAVPPGSIACTAQGVSPSNVVVGSITVPIGGGQYQAHAFRMEGTTMTDLNTLLGEDYSGANAINEEGVIVGETRIAGGLTIRGFIMDGEEITILDSLGGANSEAVAINNLGVVAGNAYLPDFTEHAFVYADGEMTDLGILAEAESSLARGINIDGIVVGYCTFPGYSNPDRAFVFVDGQMHDLNDLVDSAAGITIEVANSINEDGLIVGRGRLSTGAHHAVLLTPIEPCPGDIDGNGAVDLSDLGVVLSCFGTSACGDLDDNGTTDLSDLGIVLAAYGSNCE